MQASGQTFPECLARRLGQVWAHPNERRKLKPLASVERRTLKPLAVGRPPEATFRVLRLTLAGSFTARRFVAWHHPITQIRWKSEPRFAVLASSGQVDGGDAAGRQLGGGLRPERAAGDEAQGVGAGREVGCAEVAVAVRLQRCARRSREANSCAV